MSGVAVSPLCGCMPRPNIVFDDAPVSHRAIKFTSTLHQQSVFNKKAE